MYHVVKVRQTLPSGNVTKLHIFPNKSNTLTFMKESYKASKVMFSRDSPFEVESLFVWSN